MNCSSWTSLATFGIAVPTKPVRLLPDAFLDCRVAVHQLALHDVRLRRQTRPMHPWHLAGFARGYVGVQDCP